MKTLQFKTNIKCMGCVSKVSPFLDEKENLDSWAVDIYTPAKTLTVNTDALTAEEIIATVSKAGFTAEEIKTVK